jgi:hypothetical protein
MVWLSRAIFIIGLVGCLSTCMPVRFIMGLWMEMLPFDYTKPINAILGVIKMVFLCNTDPSAN